MAKAIFERFLDAAYESVECYESEYTSIAKKASLVHISIMEDFIDMEDPRIVAYWKKVKSDIQAQQ